MLFRSKGHHTAGTHLVQSLGEKVVVNAEIQLVVGFVPDLILAKRNIAHRQIVEISPVGGLKPGHSDVGLGIELLGNTPADGIQLHAVKTAVSHFLRQNTEEIAHTTGRFYVPTDFDTIEKAFSGVKTAEKGIKQGLSRSITDSESPFSLYSVVDFCRSKVRRHRGV